MAPTIASTVVDRPAAQALRFLDGLLAIVPAQLAMREREETPLALPAATRVIAAQGANNSRSAPPTGHPLIRDLAGRRMTGNRG
jgi:hypothetical protein